MKLTDCPACEKACSPHAAACPNCGHPFTENQRNSESTKRNAWKILTLGLGAFVLLAILGGLAFALINLLPTELVNIRGQTLNANQEKLSQDAITELRKLAAATDVGISKSNYSTMLIYAKAVAEKAVRELPESPLRKGIADTFDSYQDAHTLWDIMKDDTYYSACPTQPDTTGMVESKRKMKELFCDPVGGELARKYKIPLRVFNSGELADPQAVDEGKVMGTVFKKEGLSLIWTEARLRLEVTSGLFSKLSSS